MSNTVPQHLHEDVSASAFVREQEKKRAELDRLVEEQKARLASLNSPLPSLHDTAFSAPPIYPPVKTSNDIPSESSSAPVPRLSLSELTMNKKTTSPPSVDIEPEPVSAPLPSLREMTMLKSSEKSKDISNPPQEKKGPIRQSIPILNNDDDDDDFFEYSRNGNNSNMSIKDIMAKNGDSANQDDESAAKQRSKMWGIDIDKFDV